MHCIHEHDHTPAYIQQLCALKARLAILKEKYEELKENEEQSSQASEETDAAKQIEDLLNTIISGLVSENEFEEYKKQQSKKGYLTEIDPIYITEQELKEILNSIFLGDSEPRYKKWIFDAIKDYVKKGDMSTYIAEYLRGHDVTQYIDVDRLVNQINNLFNNYYTKAEVDTKINTAKREINDTIAQGGSITRDQFGYTPAIQANNPNSYLIGTLKLANDEYRLYGKDIIGSSGDQSGNYDDSNIRSIIEDLRTRLNNIQTVTKEQIQNEVTYILNTFDWLRSNVDWGEVFHTSGWNQQFNAYMQSVGLVSADGTSATWSNLKQKYDEISAEVQAIRQSMNPDGTINYEMLQSALETYVDTKVGAAVVNAVSRYARTDANGNVLDWLASGFTSQATSTSSFAQMYSAMDGRVAAVQTEVTALKSTAILAAEFENRVAGVVATAVKEQSVLDLIADHIDLIADEVHVVSPNGQNEGVIDLAIDPQHGYPEIRVKASIEDPDDELIFGVLTDDSIHAGNITSNSLYGRSTSLFCGDGSARLANGNLWWDDQGLLHLQYADIRDSRFENVDTSDFKAQSVKISANVFQNNVWNTGMYLYNPNTPTAYKWHRVVVDQNGFLRVDMDSQGDL